MQRLREISQCWSGAETVRDGVNRSGFGRGREGEVGFNLEVGKRSRDEGRQRERGKDRENGQRDENEDWGLGKRGIVEQREDRKRDEVVREREVEHMGVRGRLGEDVHE